MDKLKMITPDLTDKNIEQIGALFPNVITETRDENGAVKKAVDFDLLKQALSKNLVEDDNERYRLDWPGKKASLLKANTPITKTLRPCREESVNFDTTENLYIEGDNFEVLKILQESYLGKIKMIYIDPPYNTGNDFIYKDNFAKSREAYEEELGTEDEEGGKLFRNTDSNGRFHSDWLSMMYERLIVARDFLTDDGLLFISISDKEINNLKSICTEIFGEGNFIANLIWNRNHSAQAGVYKVYHEYILLFSKNSEHIKTPKSLNDDLFEAGAMKKASGRHSMQEFTFPKGTRFDAPDGTELNGEWGDIEKVILVNGQMISDKRFLKEDVTLKAAFTQIDQMKKYFYGSRDDLVDSRGQKVVEFYLSSTGKVKVVKKRGVEAPQTTLNYGSQGPISISLAELFDLSESPFDSPKPIDMIEDFIMRFTDDKDIVLDFFAGSSTTAHAVLRANSKRDAKVGYILIQYPENLEESLRTATKDGVRTLENAISFLKKESKPLLLTEIGKERIRRAGKKIVDELKEKNPHLHLGEAQVEVSELDIGFRVYKTDSSNMKDVFYHPSEIKQDQMGMFISNIKEDRTAEDLLNQVILDHGLELTLPIETKQILANTVFIVQTNAIVACFDKDIDFNILDTISDIKPLKVVFKDASFKDDKDRINLEERFKRFSPETKVTVI
jgi:adenine-specific DNA-methyltransferase